MPSTRKTWIIVASLLALVMAAATWMLLLSPVRDQTAVLKSDAESVEGTNEILTAKVAKLRSQYANIDEFRTQLRGYEVRIPTSVDYESIVKEIERSVEKSEVALISVASGEGVAPVAPYTAIKPKTPVPAADPNAPTADVADKVENAEAGTADKPDETVSGAKPTLTGALAKEIDGFYQIPLTITVQGNYDTVREFVESLQVDSKRAVLVSSITATSLRDTPESESAPEAKVGDMTFVLNALAYVLEYDTSVLGETPDGEKEPEKVVPPAGKENIFAPSRKK